MNKVSDLGATSNDATQRRGAEAALRKEESLFHLVIDDMPAAIVYVDANQRYGFVNKMAETWAAKSRHQMIGKHPWEVFGQSIYQQLEPHIDRVLAGEKVNFDAAFSYPDGSQRDVSISWVPHLDNGGRVFGYFEIANDITEIKQATEAVRERQAYLHAIAENSPSATFLKDLDSRYIFANRVWHYMYNPTGADIAGKTAHDFLPPEIADAVEAEDAKVLETGAPTVEELILPTALGEPQNLLFTKFPVFDDSGNIIALGGFNIDITERVEAESRLASTRSASGSCSRRPPPFPGRRTPRVGYSPTLGHRRSRFSAIRANAGWRRISGSNIFTRRTAPASWTIA